METIALGGLGQMLRADGLAARALSNAVRAYSLSRVFANRTVLDIGCGTMPYRDLFTSRGARYVGADIDGSPDILIGVGGALPLADESADFVLSFQVLEHVRNVQTYLETAKRILKKGGGMFLSTHGVWPYHPHPTDYWRWTREGLSVTLEDAGFRIQRMAALCGPAAWISMFPLLACKKALGPAWPVLAPLNLGINLLASAMDVATPSAIRDTNAAIFVAELSKGT
jgi:SAM-dependent methyltransferase